MARLFDDGSSQYLTHAAAVLSGVPVTFSLWFKSDDTAAEQVMVAIGRTDREDVLSLCALGHVAGDPLHVDVKANGDGGGNCYTSSGFSADTWHHALGVCATSSDRKSYIDGGSEGTDNSDKTPAGLNVTTIGCVNRGGLGDYTSGAIAEVGIWNVALSAGERAILAARFSPLFVRPQNLVAYWPLVHDDNDRVGGYNMTATNNPTWTAHPPIIYPAAPMIITAPTGAPPPVNAPTGVLYGPFVGPFGGPI